MKNYGWRGPDLPDGRVYKYADIRHKGSLPREVDMALPPVQDQGHVGCCVFKALTLAMEVAQVFGDNPEAYYLSALDAYYDYRLTYDNVKEDTGAYGRLALDRARVRGVCAESVWPYGDGSHWAMKPPTAPVYYKIKSYWGLDGNSKQEKLDNIYNALGSGTNKIVIGGFSLYDSFESDYTAKTGTITVPNYKAERFLGGHFMALKGYKADGRLHGRNSWGPWGYNQTGDFLMPPEYVLDLGSDFYVVDLVS